MCIKSQKRYRRLWIFFNMFLQSLIDNICKNFGSDHLVRSQSSPRLSVPAPRNDIEGGGLFS